MIYVVTGQTATGKTHKAIELAYQHDGEIINFDARQIYKKLDIITGKDLDLTTRKFTLERRLTQGDIGFYSLQTKNYELPTKLWLYDIVDPKRPFSSNDYQESCIIVIKDIIARKKSPILVGGTYFYLKHLLYDMLTYHVEPDWKLRESLAEKKVQELQEMVKQIDTPYFQSLNESEQENPQRLIRKIELLRSGKDLFQRSERFKLNTYFERQKVQMLGLSHTSPDELEKRITTRVTTRLANGAIEEVSHLLRIGYSATDPGLKTIGYAQCLEYLQNKLTKDELKAVWIRREIQYAKRQYTFMKKDPHIKWIAV